MKSTMQVCAVKLDGTLTKNKYDNLMHYISCEKYNRINKFHRFEDVQRSLIGDIVIRYLLCKRLKIENNKIVFGVNAYGKPYLMNYTDIHFNISHSGKWVVGCVDIFPVGIDIEQIKPTDLKIADRFFSKLEYKWLVSNNFLEKESYFYALWTLKESYIKAVGKGLSIPLDSFSIIFKENDIAVYPKLDMEDYYFKQYNIDVSYMMAVCSCHKIPSADILIFTEEELYDNSETLLNRI